MQLIHHGPVEFLSAYETQGLCFARVWVHPGGHRPGLVLVSEDPRNLGGTPFACAESLSTNICRRLGIDHDTVWYIEHFAAIPGHRGHPLGTDRFAAVVFGTDGRTPRRRALGRIPRTLTDVERLAGCVLAPPAVASSGTPITNR